MTRTSRALKRLGIAGLAAVTLGAGAPALTATVAQAAGPVTSVTYVSTSNKTGAAGTCLNYTVHAQDANGSAAGASITVTVTTTTPNADVQFCTQAQTGFGDNTVANQPGPSAGATRTQGGPVPAGGGSSTDVASFITDANGNVTFGLVSTLASTSATFTPFADNNNNGTVDPTDVAGPQGTANWTTGGPAGSTAAQNAVAAPGGLSVAPTSDNAVTGETRTFVVTAVNGTGSPVPGVQVSYLVTGAETQNATPCQTLTDNNGQTRCNVKFNTAGTSTVRFFVNQTNVAGNGPGYDVGEPTVTATETVTAAPTAGSFAVSVVCLPDTTRPLNTQSPCVNEVMDPNRSFRAVVDNTSSTSPNNTPGTRLSFAVTGGSGDETVTNSGNAGAFAGQAPAGTQSNECVTVDYTTGATPPDPSNPASSTNSYCDVIVTDPTPVSGEVLTVTATVRGTSTTGSNTLTFRNQPVDARNITLAPKTATTVPNTARAFTATVVDSLGKPVQGVRVTFSESGPGAFRNGSSTSAAVTDANGQAAIETISLPGETGTQTITVTIDADQDPTAGGIQGTQCASSAGGNGAASGFTPTGGAVPTNQTAGNCTDTATNTFASPSPSPSPSTSPSTAPPTTPPASRRPVLSTSTPDIQPNIQGILNASNLDPNTAYELQCYSRPSTTYFTARSATTSAAGSSLEFRILPGTNTRCYVRPQGNESLASNSVVINVHTTLSLSAVGAGAPRTFIFQGRNLPRRSGQLITLYRIANGQEIRTSNLTTDSSGIYRVTRKFLGTGTFQFRVRTSQTLTNAPGASNIITVTIR